MYVKGLVYLQYKNNNYYFVHDNCIVYPMIDNGEGKELYRFRGRTEKLSLFPVSLSLPTICYSFQVYNPGITVNELSEELAFNKEGKILIKFDNKTIKTLSLEELQELKIDDLYEFQIEYGSYDPFPGKYFIITSPTYSISTNVKSITKIDTLFSSDWPNDNFLFLQIKSPNLYTNLSHSKIPDIISTDINNYADKIKIKIEQNMKIKINREYKNYVSELIPDFPRLKYQKISDDEKLRLFHRGQRKLLFSELSLFNTLDYHRSYIIIYAGAAPGNHIPILSKLYPNFLFILFDPAKFNINPSSNIIIRNELFTDDVVAEFKYLWGNNIVFISDIRSTPNKDDKNYDQEFEKHVYSDMKMQEKWVKDLRPEVAMLKLRFPFDKKEMTYLSGDIEFQIYPPYDSTETRLICREIDGEYKFTHYDIAEYEEQMFYFNTKYRNQYFYDKHPLFGYSYDTLKEYHILKDLYKNRFDTDNASDFEILCLTYIIDMFLYGKNTNKYIFNLLIGLWDEIKELKTNVGKKEGKKEDELEKRLEHIESFFGIRNNIKGNPENNINFTLETLKYMSSRARADEITKIIIDNNYSKSKTIIECCAGIGGNTLSFLDAGFNVIAYEINPERRKILENNIKMYKFSNYRIKDGAFDADELKGINGNVILFLDPPWMNDKGQILRGGKYGEMKIGKYTLEQVLDIAYDYVSLIVIKAPPSYFINFARNKLFKYDKIQLTKMTIFIAVPKR